MTDRLNDKLDVEFHPTCAMPGDKNHTGFRFRMDLGYLDATQLSGGITQWLSEKDLERLAFLIGVALREHDNWAHNGKIVEDQRVNE